MRTVQTPLAVFTQSGDNRLVLMTANTNTPSGSRKSLKFDYDWQGRRISKGAGA